MLRRLTGLILVVLLLLPGAAWAEMLSVKGKKVNFRAGPSTSNKIIYSAEQYYAVKVVKHKGGWVKTKDFQGDVAWVLTRLMSKQKCLVIKVPKANLRSHARKNSKMLFTASRGAAFKIVKKQGDWYLVKHADGDRGWVHKNLTWR